MAIILNVGLFTFLSTAKTYRDLRNKVREYFFLTNRNPVSTTPHCSLITVNDCAQLTLLPNSAQQQSC